MRRSSGAIADDSTLIEAVLTSSRTMHLCKMAASLTSLVREVTTIARRGALAPHTIDWGRANGFDWGCASSTVAVGWASESVAVMLGTPRPREIASQKNRDTLDVVGSCTGCA